MNVQGVFIAENLGFYDYTAKDGSRKTGCTITVKNPAGKSARDMLIDFLVDKSLVTSAKLHLEEERNKFKGQKLRLIFFLSYFNQIPRLMVENFEVLK